jgi:inorganic pyrophosphatase
LDQARSDVSLLLTELASRDPVTGAVVAVVETPRASRNKFNYDPEIGAFRLKRVLPLGSTFPYDFGFIPSTRAEDGDPLDVLLLVDEPAPVGCVVHVRLLGVIEAEQRELDGRRVRNDRLIAAGIDAHLHADIRSISQCPKRMLDEIEAFFEHYNRLGGKEFRPLRRRGPRRASALLKQACSAFRQS